MMRTGEDELYYYRSYDGNSYKQEVEGFFITDEEPLFAKARRSFPIEEEIKPRKARSPQKNEPTKKELYDLLEKMKEQEAIFQLE